MYYVNLTIDVNALSNVTNKLLNAFTDTNANVNVSKPQMTTSNFCVYLAVWLHDCGTVGSGQYGTDGDRFPLW